MSQKRKKTTDHDYDKIENEILRDKVDEIFRRKAIGSELDFYKINCQD